ncbi:MAG TPA: hypothetical protein PLL88_00740 [Anaerolineaceae bacterium]|nr:hypothetical protein [Anaerolineaceae bacterium]
MKRSAVFLSFHVLSKFLLLMLASSCSILPFGEAWFQDDKTPGTQPTGIIFFDDFSSNTSGWDRVETDLGGTDYVSGGYHIVINEKNTDYFSTLYRTYTDIGLQADAQWVEGPYDNNFGLICRFQDEKNFYAGMISSDGYYGIFKIENGDYTVLGHETMLQSETIGITDSRKQIAFRCYQDFLFLYVNGILLDVQQDKTFNAGDVGMIAGSFEDAGVHILFDDFYLIDVTQTANQEMQE